MGVFGLSWISSLSVLGSLWICIITARSLLSRVALSYLSYLCSTVSLGDMIVAHFSHLLRRGALAMQRTASSSSSGILSLFVAMSKSSARGPRSKSSSLPRLRRRPRRVS